uniref:serine-type D-Ala-D-Ala carboxypeptidase n=1 Tax=Magnetococcus massalia (strain MO-1) TaxID=451514 RepID=A0A1S7LFC9_MAGMO|nr:putative Penicillin-binding protein (Beta-lactamase) [Candidatus Magnetococcus massalia]
MIMGSFVRTALMMLVASVLVMGEAWAEGQPFRVRAKAAIMGDMDSGAILFEQNSDAVLPPASLTKVMTLYLLYDALKKGEVTLETPMLVSKKAWKMGGSKTFVKVGDHVRVEDLIRGIAVQSGNDACVVVAEHLGGSEQGFADMMNVKAQQLGMDSSHFVNASGLPAEGHYTTAADLFKLTRAITLDFPEYAHYVKQKEYTFNGIRQVNRNRLLWKDRYVTGLKTGHTRAAGYCLISTREKTGQRLASVVMGSRSTAVREEESLRMLRYGNRAFETVNLFDAGASVRTMRVWKGDKKEVDGVIYDPVQVTVPKRQRGSLEVGILFQDPLVAPVRQGQQLGALVVKLGDKELMRRPVVAKEEIAEGNMVNLVLDSMRLQLGW